MQQHYNLTEVTIHIFCENLQRFLNISFFLSQFLTNAYTHKIMTGIKYKIFPY